MKLTKKLFFPKPLFFILTGVLAAVVVLFFTLTRFLPTKEDRYISELEELMRPLDVSELNILFITLDTTRADRLGCYGYHRAETPHMDRLAETGILFKNATCQAPLTIPKDPVKVDIQLNGHEIHLVSGESILARTGVKIEK